MGGREPGLGHFSFKPNPIADLGTRITQDLLELCWPRWKQHWDPIAQVKVMLQSGPAKLERSCFRVDGVSNCAEWFESKPGGILVISQTIEPIQFQGVGPNQVEKSRPTTSN